MRIRRRDAIIAAASALAVSELARAAAAEWEQWNYPSGWPASRDWTERGYRVANYSGGYERMFPAHTIARPASPSPLHAPDEATARAFAPVAERAAAYLKAWPITGLLIARRGTVLFESYQFKRDASMRMHSWSMAKSVTSLLLGICIDRGLVKSLDDRAEDYVPELKGMLHGGVTLRNLANMSSGAAILHERDNRDIYPRAFTRPGGDLEAVVRGWNVSAEPQGARWNYNELCPLTIGMVIRRVTGKTLAAFCEETLWQPLGAEADATWLCDGRDREFNCIGFGARLRDWARLGQLVAQRGAIDGRQVVSAKWIEECASWSDADAQARFDRAKPKIGYKCFFWHGRPNGTWMMMVGHDGQRVIIERNTEVVVVQTAVDESAAWRPELNEIVNAAGRIPQGG
jgi:hypothetical protein